MMFLWKRGVALMALFVLVAVPASAQFTPIAQPNAAYTGSTTLLNFADPDFNNLASLGDGTLNIDFSAPLVALTVPGTWATWALPPNTETATPRVLWTDGLTTLDLSFNGGVGIFGLEAQPNTEVPSLITASFFNGGTLLGTIPINVNGNGGARLFAAQTTGLFTRVSLTSTDDFAIARLRYGNLVSTAAPEPGVLPLMLVVGLFHAAGWRRRKQRK
jgi:hypothetical protein